MEIEVMLLRYVGVVGSVTSSSYVAKGGCVRSYENTKYFGHYSIDLEHHN